jgi:hypothetical protein
VPGTKIGFAYAAPTFHPEFSSHEAPSLARVWEDGRPLPGPGNARHDDIRKVGRGRYSFWHSSLYFSASDNTDPSANGRSYEIGYPRVVGLAAARIAYSIALLALAGTALFAARNHDLPEVAAIRRAASSASKHPFILSAAILTAVFLITRLPFFVQYPVVGITKDTDTYSYLTDVLNSGKFPHFVMRTPGYPLFIWLVTFLSKRWLAVIVTQNLLTLLSSLCLVYAVSLLRRQLALPAALAMSGLVGSSQALFFDTSALSDSLYASSIVFSIALLLMAVARRGPIAFLGSSAMMAFTILVRPAGMYLIVIYALLLAYMLWNRFPRAASASFALPLPAALLALCGYNYLTIGAFVISPLNELYLVGATILYWEPDPALPLYVNDALKKLPESYREVGLTGDDFATLRTSWDADLLYGVFSKSYNKLTNKQRWGNGNRLSDGLTEGPSPGAYLRNREYIRQLSLKAIRNHPSLYAKFVWANMLHYLNNITSRADAYSAIAARAQGVDGANEQGRLYPAKDLADSPPPGAIQLGAPVGQAAVVWSSTPLGKLGLTWQEWHWDVFGRLFWVWAWLAVMIMSAGRFIRSRGRHLGAFILFLLGLVVVGACLEVCLVELGEQKYSFPTQFIYYLSVALVPLLWLDVDSSRRRA